MKCKNIQMEMMLTKLKPLLPHRDKIGYIAARNTRMLTEVLTEYTQFKNELIKKYGEVDKDEKGNELQTISLHSDSENFKSFMNEFDQIKDIEHEINLMTIPYAEVIGILNGEEIIDLDFMLTE